PARAATATAPDPRGLPRAGAKPRRSAAHHRSDGRARAPRRHRRTLSSTKTPPTRSRGRASFLRPLDAVTAHQAVEIVAIDLRRGRRPRDIAIGLLEQVLDVHSLEEGERRGPRVLEGLVPQHHQLLGSVVVLAV